MRYLVLFLIMVGIVFGAVPDTLIGGDWSASFVWRPEHSSLEVMGTESIATAWTVEGTYIHVYWTSDVTSAIADGGNFYASDGTDTITLASTYGFEYEENVKVCITHDDAAGTNLYIEVMSEGTLTDSSADCIALGNLNYIQFAANPSRAVTGRGFFGDVKIWDSVLDATNAQKVFDLDSSATAPTVTHTVDDLQFSRDSIRFDRSMTSYSADEPQVETKIVAKRVTPEVLDLAVVPQFVEGTKCYYAQTAGVYSTTDGTASTGEYVIANITAFDTAVAAGYTAQEARRMGDGGILLSLRLIDGGGAGFDYGKVFKMSPAGTWSEVLDSDKGVFPSFPLNGIRDNEIVLATYNNHIDETTEPLNANEIWYSDDYGASFDLLVTLDNDDFEALYPNRANDAFDYGDAAGASGFHLHMAGFGADTDTIIVYHADGEFSDQIVYEYGGSGGKDSWANWSHVTNMGHRAQPISHLFKNGSIYVGCDGSLGGYGTIGKINLSTYAIEPVCYLPRPTNGDEVPYWSTQAAWAFSIEEISGLTYFGAYHGTEASVDRVGGMFVSSNGDD